jgi:hypothetical protein
MPPEDCLLVRQDLLKARQGFVMASDLHLTFLVTPIRTDLELDWQRFYDLHRQLSATEQRVGELVGLNQSYLQVGKGAGRQGGGAGGQGRRGAGAQGRRGAEGKKLLCLLGWGLGADAERWQLLQRRGTRALAILCSGPHPSRLLGCPPPPSRPLAPAGAVHGPLWAQACRA